MADTQREVMEFLAGAAIGAAVERIDTHISAIFLTGERVFKLKKAVRLPFLDFTGLEARHHACVAEVEINRRAAPALYRGVTAITRQPDGSLALGGEGEAVDYVVEMVRFDGDTLFDRLIARNGLDRQAMTELTESIVAFHRSAPIRRDRGGTAGLAWTIDTNRASMLPHVPDLLAADDVETLAAASHQALERFGPLLEQRRAAGFVRQCHGDLHLGNICLFEGRPTLFDAIEFSEDIACIDVFYDLAFLLMDLDRHGAGGLASVVMNHYFDLTGDYAAIGPLPLFLSARAGVRAHVAATTAIHAEGERRLRLREEAGATLSAALAYLTPPPPRLLAVGGLSGSGKSRMSRELAPHLGVPGAVVVRSDALRKQLMGVSVHDRLGADGYTSEMTGRTYQALLDTCAQVLKSGHSAVADAVFARPEERAAIEAVAVAAGVRFDALWLETPPDLAAERITTRRANASDATPEVLLRQLEYDLGDIAWTRVYSGSSKEVTLADGRRALGL